MLYSCSVTKHLPMNELLLKKNEIEIKAPLKLATNNISQKELLDIAKPTENKSWFSFLKPIGIRYKFKLMVFNAFSNGKLTAVKLWVQQNMGEPPSLYDSALVQHSVINMREYLINKGYYNATVDAQVKKKKKKVTVKYIVHPQTQYVLNEIVEMTANADIQQLLNENKALNLLKTKDAYSSLNVKAERERIEILLRNNGYFNFSQQYILVELDSSYNNSKRNFALFDLFTENKRPVNLRLIVKNPEQEEHQKFSINNVYIFPNQHSDSANIYTASDTLEIEHFHFVTKHFNIKPGTMLDNIFISPGIIYSLENQQKTNTRLASLGLFKNINIQYIQTAKDKLDAYIFLTQNKKHEYGYEVVASTTSEFYGLGLNVHENSKNIFRTGDLLTINLKSSIESPYETVNRSFHTLDLGAQGVMQFPRFMLPFRPKKISANENPKTKISLSYNYLERQDYYKQNQTNFLFGYDWNETKKKHHYLNPFILSFINYNQITDTFQSILNSNPLLLGSFKPQLIPGMNYTYTYFSFDPNVIKPVTYFFKAYADVAGNLSMLVAKTFFKTSSPVKIFGNELSQFAKLDIENKVHIDLNKHQSLVLRTLTGAGLAYGNSSVLPYIKQFYLGGPNDMRGWRARTLGTGIYQDPNLINNPLYVNETGDIRLEGNVEYRFDLWWYFKGALFSDVGNIWLMKKDADRPGAEFDVNTFYKQMAVDAGAGIRFDYNYFLLRFDVGFPIVNPQLPADEKYLGNQIDITSGTWRKNNLKYNLAIGYPF